MPEVFTIGHSSHEFEVFIELLRMHATEVVADVRSHPYSRWPQFRREALASSLKSRGIEYVFLGLELGAFRSEPEAYREGEVDFDRVKSLPLFRQGLDQLLQLAAERRVAMMCAEKEPLDCHRTRLICPELRGRAAIRHILADGSLEDDSQTQKREALRRAAQRTLF